MGSTHGPITIPHSRSCNNHLHDEEVGLDDEEEDHHHHHCHLHSNLSRLSRCTSNTESISKLSSGYGSSSDGENEEEDDMDHDADEELSEESSDSEKEEVGCLSLPATPRRRRILRGGVAVKEYASENEAKKSSSVTRRRSSRRVSGARERWLERSNWEEKKKEKEKGVEDVDEDEQTTMSGESECLVITRAKGGRRSLCMDLGEVKACRDLGFELEPDRTQCVFTDTSSGGNSPLSSWRISSPGDDPKEVKARLKVWAQAVALASASPSYHIC